MERGISTEQTIAALPNGSVAGTNKDLKQALLEEFKTIHDISHPTVNFRFSKEVWKEILEEFASNKSFEQPSFLERILKVSCIHLTVTGIRNNNINALLVSSSLKDYHKQLITTFVNLGRIKIADTVPETAQRRELAALLSFKEISFNQSLNTVIAESEVGTILHEPGIVGIKFSGSLANMVLNTEWFIFNSLQIIQEIYENMIQALKYIKMGDFNSLCRLPLDYYTMSFVVFMGYAFFNEEFRSSLNHYGMHLLEAIAQNIDLFRNSFKSQIESISTLMMIVYKGSIAFNYPESNEELQVLLRQFDVHRFDLIAL